MREYLRDGSAQEVQWGGVECLVALPEGFGVVFCGGVDTSLDCVELPEELEGGDLCEMVRGD